MSISIISCNIYPRGELAQHARHKQNAALATALRYNEKAAKTDPDRKGPKIDRRSIYPKCIIVKH
jgi:hypothetical protein